MGINIIGMMWNKNEGDILAEIISEAVKHVDLLYIADDGSTDNSWEIITSLKKRYDKIEFIQRNPNKNDPGQRQALLTEIRKRYKSDVWIQIIESDIMIVDTDVREAIEKFAVNDLAVTWQMLNAVRAQGTWAEVDTYPVWDRSIKEIMPLAHRTECMVYTFKNLPDLYYTPVWRPWPSGFSRYTKSKIDIDRREPDSPLLAHYGFRGIKHFQKKYHTMGKRHRRYPTWDLSSLESIEQTVPYFNGQWNGRAYLMGRKSWTSWLENKRRGVWKEEQ